MTEALRRVVLVFAKAPIPGQVKTRLRANLEASECAALHAELVRRTLQTVATAKPDRLELWCEPDVGHTFFQACESDYSALLHAQSGQDLGKRMDHAFRSALTNDVLAVLVGSDCPALTPGYIDAAFQQLESGHQAVLGPAEDGGYVLIGLRAPVGSLFVDIPWGSHQVLAQTRLRLTEAGLSWAELETLWDLDRPEDLARYRQDLAP